MKQVGDLKKKVMKQGDTKLLCRESMKVEEGKTLILWFDPMQSNELTPCRSGFLCQYQGRDIVTLKFCSWLEVKWRRNISKYFLPKCGSQASGMFRQSFQDFLRSLPIVVISL